MSPGEVADGVGWAPLIGLTVSVAGGLLTYGATNQRNRRTAEDLAELKREHADQIGKAQSAADKASTDLTAHKLEVLKDFVSKDSLAAVERRLGDQINGMKAEVFQKVDEIKVEFGKKSVEHTIKTTLQSELARVLLAAKGKIVE